MKFIKYEDTYVNLNQVTLFKKVTDDSTNYVIFKIQFITEAIDFTFDFEAEKERDEYFKKIEDILGMNDVWKIEQVQQEIEWRPIETAPNGSAILTLRTHPKEGEYYIHDVAFLKDDKFFSLETLEQIYPTHWIPLPKPPKK